MYHQAHIPEAGVSRPEPKLTAITYVIDLNKPDFESPNYAMDAISATTPNTTATSAGWENDKDKAEAIARVRKTLGAVSVKISQAIGIDITDKRTQSTAIVNDVASLAIILGEGKHSKEALAKAVATVTTNFMSILAECNALQLYCGIQKPAKKASASVPAPRTDEQIKNDALDKLVVKQLLAHPDVQTHLADLKHRWETLSSSIYYVSSAFDSRDSSPGPAGTRRSSRISNRQAKTSTARLGLSTQRAPVFNEQKWSQRLTTDLYKRLAHSNFQRTVNGLVASTEACAESLVDFKDQLTTVLSSSGFAAVL